MQEESIGQWLGELASSAPAPGGGAAAALEAATAAALVEMVCNLTIGKPAYAEHETAMTAALERAGTLRTESLGLASEDAAAFTAVIAAYRLPKETEPEVAARSRSIQSALAEAADVPRRTAETASEILGLAESIVAGSNINVVSDLAAAAAAARAALQTALVNIEINSSSITDSSLQESLAGTLREIERDLVRSDEIVASVRGRLAG